MSRITHAPPDIILQTITPGLAKKWLETLNTNNRNLRRRKVSQYASMMKRGQWMPDGDTYKFDRDGILLDGQHRLAAIVESGHTVKNAVIMKGLPPETFKVLDTGMLRTPGDALGHGVPSASHKAAAIRLLWIVDLTEDDPRSSLVQQAVTRTDIASYYDDYTDDVDYASKTGDRLYNAFKGGSRAAWIAFIALAMRANAGHAEEFLEGVFSGANLGKNDPRLALRNWLSNARRLPNAGAHLGILIKSWNNWMNGKTRFAMVFRDEEPFPKLVTRKTIAV